MEYIYDTVYFIHSFIYLLNKTIVKSAVKCTVEQDSKDKALTAAQKLKLHKNDTSAHSRLYSVIHVVYDLHTMDSRQLKMTDDRLQ